MPGASTLRSGRANTTWRRPACDNRPVPMKDHVSGLSNESSRNIDYQTDEAAILLLGFFVHLFQVVHAILQRIDNVIFGVGFFERQRRKLFFAFHDCCWTRRELNQDKNSLEDDESTVVRRRSRLLGSGCLDVALGELARPESGRAVAVDVHVFILFFANFAHLHPGGCISTGQHSSSTFTVFT